MSDCINLTRFWTEEDDLVQAEIQIEAQPDEDTYTSDDTTALQVFSLQTGEPVSGQAVLDADKLAELYAAIGRRLAELGYPGVTK